MDRKKLVLLLGALVIAIGTALAARSMFAGASAPKAAAAPAQPQGPKVLVAKRALPVGTIITADAVGYQLWPKEMVQDAYFVDGEADMNKLLGTVVRHPITAGEPVTQGALVYPGDRGFLAAALGPGMRAVTVPVSEKTGVGGFVFPGDHVDLMLTQTVNGADGQDLKATETILKNIRVLATDQKTESSTDDNGKTVVKAFRTVTLEATPKVAEEIEVAQTIGTLSLALRSLADDQQDLDKMLASSDVNIPNNLSKDAENKLLRQVSTIPQQGDDFVTGGDVSRFQRKTVPPRTSQSAAPAGPSGPQAAPVHVGPVVRVFRGHAVTQEPISGAVNGLVGAEAQGAARAAGTVPGASAAGMVVG
jgi:pilus assembly protein CpaB